MSILTLKALQAYATLLQELVAIGDGEPDALLKALWPSAATDAAQQPEPTATVSVVRDDTVAVETSSPADQNGVADFVAPTTELASAKPRRPAAKRAPAASFDELWQAFIDEKIYTLREWKKSRRPELTASGRLWTWLIGKDPGLATSANIQDARNLYLWLPKGYDRARDDADRTPQQIVDAAKAAWQAENPGKRSAAAYARISAKTFNKHLSNWRGFFIWLEVRKYVPSGSGAIFDKLGVRIRKKGKAGNAEREAYSLAEVQRIFEGPVWTGRRSVHAKHKPGEVIVADSLYWIPLMCAFLGMRREEASQLKVRHVVQNAGIWTIDLRAGSVDLNSFGAVAKRVSASVRPRPGLAAAR